MDILHASHLRAAADELDRCRLVPSETAHVGRTADGQVLHLAPPVSPWLHPWSLETRWNVELSRWEARIAVPGFVNGLEAVVDSPRTEQVSLLDYPWLPLALRTVGLPGDRIPAFFQALGAKAPAANLSITAGGGLSIVDDLESQQPRRTLCACDIFLAQARPSYRQTITVVDVTGVTGLVVDYAVTYDTANLDLYGRRCRVRVAPQFPPVRRPTWFERLTGSWQDDGEDRLQIATVYLLSPEDVSAGDPDASWTPYVQEHLFWHLRYGSRNELPRKPIPAIRIATGLLGGLADAIGNQILAPINELTARLDAALSLTSPEGKFWTHA